MNEKPDKLLDESYFQKSIAFQNLTDEESRENEISKLYDPVIKKLKTAEEIRKEIQKNDNYESDDEIKEIVGEGEEIQNAIDSLEQGKKESIKKFKVKQNTGIGFIDLLKDLKKADQVISKNIFGPLNKYNENLKN